MLRLSILFLFISSLLVAQTDIIVRKLILRDAADTKFWTLSQDLAPDTTTILLTDDTGSLRMDWDAQDGVQFFNHILPGADDTYTLGTNDVRFGTGFATVWNGEIIRIENSAHTAHFGLIHDAAGLQFLDTSDLQMFLLEPSGGNSVLNSSLIPHADKTNRLGTTLLRWDPIHGENIIAYNAFVVESDDAARFVTCNSTTFAWPLCTVTGEWDSSGGTGGDIRTSAFYIANSAGSIRVNSFITGDNGTIHITNDGGFVAALIGTEGDGGQADSGYLQIDDSSGRDKFHVGIDSGGDPVLVLRESGSDIGSASEVVLAARAEANAVNSFLIRNNDGVDRIKAGTRDTSGAGGQLDVRSASASIVSLISSSSVTTGLWIGTTLVVGEDELVLQSDQSTGDGEGAHLIGITKDAADTIEADNFSISPDGNFYARIFSGSDVTCTTVDDGWLGYRTDTNEIQICDGGAVVVIALAAP